MKNSGYVTMVVYGYKWSAYLIVIFFTKDLGQLKKSLYLYQQNM